MSGKLKGPWLGWGPYLWTDGLAGAATASSGRCERRRGRRHAPVEDGVQKVVTMLSTFFKTDPTAKRWYVSRANQPNPPDRPLYYRPR